MRQPRNRNNSPLKAQALIKSDSRQLNKGTPCIFILDLVPMTFLVEFFRPILRLPPKQVCVFLYSFLHLRYYDFHSFIHPFIHSFIRLFVYSFIYSFSLIKIRQSFSLIKIRQSLMILANHGLIGQTCTCNFETFDVFPI